MKARVTPTDRKSAPAQRCNTARKRDFKANHTEPVTRRVRLAAERAGAMLDAGGYLRLPEVLALVPVGATTWWKGCRDGRFPKGVKLGARCTAWSAASIRELLERIESGAVAT